MNIILFGLIAIVTISLIGLVLQKTHFKNRYASIKPYGKIVEIEGGKIHLHSMGNGEKTIVLLPGMGIALPSADFGPLMRELSKTYKVVCLEYFGVGFSSETFKERTCDNYVNEIREALKLGGFNGPYILMPHSVSSIYSEYYASKYPDEIEMIISLDGTPTNFYQETPKFFKYLLKIAKGQQSIGLNSFLVLIVLNKKKLIKEGYTQKEISDMISYGGFSLTNTVLNQMENSMNFIKDTMELEFPKSISYFKIISKKTYETRNKQLKMTPQEFQHEHLKRIGEHSRYEVLDGDHFIYKNNTYKILEIVDQLQA